MKKILITIIMFQFFGSTVFAQKTEQRASKIESMKVGFISSKLNLNTEEAQRFWPLYNEFTAELENINKDNPKRREAFDNMTDLEASQLLSDILEDDEKKVALKKSFAERMSREIGAKKTIMYFYMETQFKKEMLKDLKGRMNNKMKNKNGRGR